MIRVDSVRTRAQRATSRARRALPASAPASRAEVCEAGERGASKRPRRRERGREETGRSPPEVPDGFILTLVVLLLASGFTFLAVVTALRTIAQDDFALTHRDRVASRYAVEACADDALLQLRRDPAYVGGAATLGDATCTIAVTGSGASRTVSVSGVARNQRHTFTIDVATSPFAMTRWAE